MTHNTIQWPNEKAQMGNMYGEANSNDTQYNGQMKRDKWEAVI